MDNDDDLRIRALEERLSRVEILLRVLGHTDEPRTASPGEEIVGYVVIDGNGEFCGKSPDSDIESMQGAIRVLNNRTGRPRYRIARLTWVSTEGEV